MQNYLSASSYAAAAELICIAIRFFNCFLQRKGRQFWEHFPTVTSPTVLQSTRDSLGVTQPTAPRLPSHGFAGDRLQLLQT